LFVKHQDFRQVGVGETLDAIEGSILPSLTLLLERAAAAEPGFDAEARAAELRALAEQLEALTALLDGDRPRTQPVPSPFSTDA
jgi:hypothetical protein